MPRPMPGKRTRTPSTLHLYRRPAGVDDLPWEAVEEQLVGAGTYWTVGVTRADRPADVPHPRPVWGAWLPGRDELLLSIGSPTMGRDVAADPRVTVHLDSGTDVVIVEGTAAALEADDERIPDFLTAYNPKYDWDYDVAQLGPPVLVAPSRVLAWRSGGFAGRDGFKLGGKWTFG